MKEAESTEIIWEAPEFEYRHKSVDWYWASIIAAALIFLLAIFMGNILFAIFVVMAETMLIFWAKQYPENIRFKLDRKGLHLGTMKFYEYEDFEGFHIIERAGEDGDAGKLIFKTKSKLHPYIKILFAGENASKIKNFLKQYLGEVEYEESLTDGISKMIGF
ncbi:MAG: hypothetical protein A3I89_00095 [Candidatus Harrisonbacteria bacterium RIFCSPLOWO2_02_FULL_41_11]|uniref:DUF5673 domain-containing protein n=1 Tax=Candidatus Harrisonbacteria bacterium RIFCSPHIGHO2_02_FULL_42_16 TaxID=1798404 RepID=A0A1G1ZHI7_9BACT|nr:MAG: hypothetical protein A3B92_04150 [Candidatus Harrisonbacteria bacterium RIFCSPHIGHO2_02_FULL_42_16]OGY66906.1 MAG: hypothetical protein A3I89_00095 [Candidatus Harrisonbacteria bacterium RIFCSPLOWO2_02_FULL_41_11]